MRIDLCRLHPGEVTMEKIDTIRGIVVNAWDGVLGIVQNLRPTLLDDLGLVAAIKSLLDLHLAENNINYFMNSDGVADKRFGPEVEITLFRVVQEAIANIARHAHAENVFVLFKIEDNIVNVDIEDDGEGFDLSLLFAPGSRDAKDRRGLGLLGMRGVLLIGGKIEICSMPGLGTRVGIRIPLGHAEAGHA
jgi:signal transduction histidine kinase